MDEVECLMSVLDEFSTIIDALVLSRTGPSS